MTKVYRCASKNKPEINKTNILPFYCAYACLCASLSCFGPFVGYYLPKDCANKKMREQNRWAAHIAYISHLLPGLVFELNDAGQ